MVPQFVYQHPSQPPKGSATCSQQKRVPDVSRRLASFVWNLFASGSRLKATYDLVKENFLLDFLQSLTNFRMLRAWWRWWNFSEELTDNTSVTSALSDSGHMPVSHHKTTGPSRSCQCPFIPEPHGLFVMGSRLTWGCSKLLSPCKLCISESFLKRGHSLNFYKGPFFIFKTHLNPCESWWQP